MKEMRRIVLLDITEKCEELNSNNLYGIDDVRGVSNTKQFMKTKANVSDRDFSKFQIVKPDYFVFNRRTTRNGEKIGMGFNNSTDIYICTEDYVVFKIREDCKKNILPTYLYLFFLRNEFDRYARYHSSGSATEFFNWEDMQRVSLLVPDIKEQQKIVDTYNAITNRIQIKQKINENLEKTAQCLFEEMWNSEDTQEIELSNISELTSSKRVFFDEYVPKGVPFYRGGEITEKRKGIPISDPLFITEESYKEKINKYGVPKAGDILITAVGTIGNSYMVTENDKFYFKDGNLIWFKNFKDNSNYIIYDFLNSKEFKKKIEQISIGSTQTALTISGLSKIKTKIPKKNDYEEYIRKSNSILKSVQSNNAELENMYKLREIVVSQIS